MESNSFPKTFTQLVCDTGWLMTLTRNVEFPGEIVVGLSFHGLYQSPRRFADLGPGGSENEHLFPLSHKLQDKGFCERLPNKIWSGFEARVKAYIRIHLVLTASISPGDRNSS